MADRHDGGAAAAAAGGGKGGKILHMTVKRARRVQEKVCVFVCVSVCLFRGPLLLPAVFVFVCALRPRSYVLYKAPDRPRQLKRCW